MAADLGKMWFEMGVRDNVTNSLGKILEMTKILQGDMNKVVASAHVLGTIKPVKFDNGKAVRDALNYQKMLLRIDDTMERISARKLTATVGVDKLDHAAKQLQDFRDQLVKLQSLNGNDWNGDMLTTQNAALRNVLQVVNNLLREQQNAQNGAAAQAQANAKANMDLVAAYDKVVEKGGAATKVLGQLQNQIGVYASVYGFERLMKSIIQIGGEFEVQHIALQSILGDIQQANSMFEQTKELAVVSPFNFRELVTYSKQIAAFGIPYEEMYDTTKRLADMSAGLGVDMQRLILAYGQVRSAAVLRGQELRQFTEAGIPMVQALAQEFTRLNGRVVSTAEVFELISKRAVPFEMVKKVLWDMTSEGGRFYDMQFTLADTLTGKWSNLQDAWEIMLSDFARGETYTGKFLKGMVSLLTEVIERVNTLTPLLMGLASSYALIKSAKWINGKRDLGFVGIDQNIKSAQRLRAIELSRLKINGEITQAQYRQLMQQNFNAGNYYKVLAMEGRLNALQIQKAYNQGYINKQTLVYLAQLRLITNEEKKQIMLNNLKAGALGRVGFAAKGLFRSLNAMMGPMGWILLAVDLIATGLMTWKSHISEINSKNEQLAQGLSKRREELSGNLDSMPNIPTNDDEYKNSIERLKELLKQHSANYKSIILESEGLTTLAEKYSYLKNALEETMAVYSSAEALAPDFANATRDTLNDVKEWARELSKNKGAGRYEFSFDFDEFQFRKNEDIFLDRIKGLAEKIKEQIPNVGKDSFSNGLYRQLRNNLEEELGVGAREKLFINIKLDEMLKIQDDDALADIITDRFSNAISSSEPRIANKIRNGKELNEAEKSKVQELVNAAIQDTEKQYPLFANKLQSLLDSSKFTALIRLNFERTGNSNDLQKFIYKNFPEYQDEKLKTIATSWATSGSMFSAQNSAKQDIDKAYNEKISRQKALDRLKKDKKAEKEQIEQAQKLVDAANTSYNELITAASVGLGYDYEGEKKRSNKENKTNKKDSQLETIKNQVELYKKFYSEMENAKKLYGRQGSKDFLQKNGFTSVFGWNLSDVSDYRKSLTELTKGLDRSTEDRRKFLNTTDADIVIQKRKEETDSMKAYISELQRMMSVMNENYQTYKKWVELTGDERLAANVAGVTQNTSYASYLTDLMKKELDKANIKMSPEEVFGMNESQLNDFGESISAVWKAWQENAKKVKKEQWDMYESAIKSAKSYEDKLNDINRKLEREKGLINQLNIPQDEKEKLIKNRTDEAGKETSKLVWDNFKETEDWGRIFSNLDRVSNVTIENMIQELEKVAPKIKGSVEDTKALYEALDKLRDQQEKRNPFAAMSSALGAASLARSLMGRFGTSKVNPKATIGISKSEAKKLGLGDATRVSYGRLQDIEKGSENKFNESLSGLQNEFKALQDVLQPVIDLFDAMGNKTLSDIFSAGSNALGSAANTANAFSTLSNAFGGKDKPIGKILGKAGPWGAVAAAGLSIVTTAIGMFGADYGDYNKMKEQYEGLINVWDDLIDRKKEYLNESWGEEAKRAGKEALSLLKSEIEQTKVVAESRLGSGSSWGSHSIEYRMWEGSYDYNGKNWRDVAKEISSALNGVKFESMSDMLNMSAEQLLWIKENYAGLWAHMDSDFKEYLEKLIKYGDAEKDLLDELQQKLTGMDFEDMVSEYANSLSSMEDANAELGENLEENLKNAILSAMIANVYGDRIKKLIAKTNELASNNDKILDQSGKVVSEYTAAEYAEIRSLNDQLEREMEESRDMLARAYGWTNKNGSSSTNSLGKAITEQDTSLWSSYLNAIRLDVSVNRVTLADILKLVQSQGDMPVIARAQLEQLEAIASYTSRNAVAAERIYSLLHGVAPDGTSIKIK